MREFVKTPIWKFNYSKTQFFLLTFAILRDDLHDGGWMLSTTLMVLEHILSLQLISSRVS